MRVGWWKACETGTVPGSLVHPHCAHVAHICRDSVKVKREHRPRRSLPVAILRLVCHLRHDEGNRSGVQDFIEREHHTPDVKRRIRQTVTSIQSQELHTIYDVEVSGKRTAHVSCGCPGPTLSPVRIQCDQFPYVPLRQKLTCFSTMTLSCSLGFSLNNLFLVCMQVAIGFIPNRKTDDAFRADAFSYWLCPSCGYVFSINDKDIAHGMAVGSC